jgi:hypothetical protein
MRGAFSSPSERVKAGVARARETGQRLGRPRKVNGEWEAMWPIDSSEQVSQTEAARRFDVSQATISRLCKKTVESASPRLCQSERRIRESVDTEGFDFATRELPLLSDEPHHAPQTEANDPRGITIR